MQKNILVWFRRNLRLADNAVLQTAAAQGLPLVAVVSMPSENERQRTFYQQAAAQLHMHLAEWGIPLFCVSQAEEMVALADQFHVAKVFADEAYSPTEIRQDNHIWQLFNAKQIELVKIKDRVVFEKAEIMSEHGKAYTEFLPYRQAWLDAYCKRPPMPSETQLTIQTAFNPVPPFTEQPPTALLSQTGGEQEAVKKFRSFCENKHFYAILKDFPAKKGTSQISAYVQAGCISVRALVHKADHAWRETLIRRDFYQQLLFHHPEMIREPLFAIYAERQWQDNDEALLRWQTGKTGFPLIDAAMRCLNRSGWLHPLLRLVVAEFLCIGLSQNWQYGAKWFAAQLTDYDEAANIGNWQSAAGLLSLRAQRLKNPVVQSQQLDPDGTFIRRYLPELAHLPKDLIHAPWQGGADIVRNGYPLPIQIASH